MGERWDTWYVSRDGATAPARTWDQLVTAARIGDVLPDDLVWADGDVQSRRAGDVEGLDLDIIALCEAWLVSGTGDPQAPLRRILNRRGRLVLHADRLLFADSRGRILHDLPLRELHSVAAAEAGGALQVWHGPTRLRFLIPGTSELVILGPTPSDALSTALFASDALALRRIMRANRAIVEEWMALLTPRVGSPPPGVKVRRPRRGAVYIALMAVQAIVLILGVAAVTILPLLLLAG